MQFLTLSRRDTETFSEADFAPRLVQEAQRARCGPHRQAVERWQMPKLETRIVEGDVELSA